MENKPTGKQKQDYWWSQGLRIFAEASGWIAAPVIAALFIGRWLDSKYQSAPWYFLGLTILAFIISSIGIGMTGVKYMKQMEKEEADKKHRPQGDRPVGEKIQTKTNEESNKNLDNKK